MLYNKFLLPLIISSSSLSSAFLLLLFLHHFLLVLLLLVILLLRLFFSSSCSFPSQLPSLPLFPQLSAISVFQADHTSTLAQLSWIFPSSWSIVSGQLNNTVVVCSSCIAIPFKLSYFNPVIYVSCTFYSSVMSKFVMQRNLFYHEYISNVQKLSLFLFN